MQLCGAVLVKPIAESRCVPILCDVLSDCRKKNKHANMWNHCVAAISPSVQAHFLGSGPGSVCPRRQEEKVWRRPATSVLVLIHAPFSQSHWSAGDLVVAALHSVLCQPHSASVTQVNLVVGFVAVDSL